jgi:hypothetical protein
VNGHFPAQPFGFSPFLGLHGVKNRSWYVYHVAIFSLFSPKTGPNAAANETSTDPSSLSDLSDRSEEKADLRQISRVFEANSWLFNEKMREIWPSPAFP